MRPIPHPLLMVLLGGVQLFAIDIHRTASSFVSQAREVEMEEYSSNAANADVPVMVMLSGSGGVQSPNMPFESQARLFASGGYRVYLPHYLDVTHGSPRDPAKHYANWAQAVRDALTLIQVQTHIAPSRIDAYVRTFDRPPPLLILHEARDKVLPVFNARQLAKLCGLKHVACKLSIYDGEGHAFSRDGIAHPSGKWRSFWR